MALGGFQVRLVSAKADVRRFLDRLDNEEVRGARRLAIKARRGSLDVLHLGNSTTEWIDPKDTDRRPLFRMIADELVNPAGYLCGYGGSYDFELHDAYLRFALRVGAPKVVLVPLWYRGRFRPWREHPVFSRDRATEVIGALPADVPLWRIRRSFPRPMPEEWKQYQAIPFDTFAGLPTVGDYTSRLKDPANFADDPEARTKLFYAYHLTHRIEDDLPELEAVERLGRTLRDSELAVVVYENPVPIDGGVQCWGEQFREVATANFAILRDRFLRGYGSHLDVVETGMTVPPAEFIDPSIADEHMTEVGRRRVRDAIVDAIAQVRPELVRARERQ